MVLSARSFGNPDLRFYALADGIKRLLAGVNWVVTALDDGKHQNVPDLHIWLGKAEVLPECKSCSKAPPLIKKEEAWAILQKAADFALANFESSSSEGPGCGFNAPNCRKFIFSREGGNHFDGARGMLADEQHDPSMKSFRPSVISATEPSRPACCSATSGRASLLDGIHPKRLSRLNEPGARL